MEACIRWRRSGRQAEGIYDRSEKDPVTGQRTFVLLVVADVWAVTQAVVSIFFVRLFVGLGRHVKHGVPTVGWFVVVIFFAILTIGLVSFTVKVARSLVRGKRTATK